MRYLCSLHNYLIDENETTVPTSLADDAIDLSMDGAFTVATGTRSELGGELVAIPDPLLYGGQHSSDDHKHQRRSPPDMHHGYLLGLIVDVIAKGTTLGAIGYVPNSITRKNHKLHKLNVLVE